MKSKRLSNAAKSTPAKRQATAEPTPQQEEEAFATYWQSLIDQSAALACLHENHPIRGLVLSDFRAAMRDAFLAGRNSTL